MPEQMPEETGWIGWFPGRENPDLARELVERLRRRREERQRIRGPRQARVVVDVYDNGEAEP